MKQLIMLTDFYYPRPLANGICIHQIAQALITFGYQVHVICFQQYGEAEEDSYEGVTIHRVKPRLFYRLNEYADRKGNSTTGSYLRKLSLLLHRIKRLLFLLSYPFVAPLVTYRYYKKTQEVIAKYKITDLVAQYNPMESAVALYQLKKRNKDLRSILYVVDSLTNSPNAQRNHFLNYSSWRWEKRFYSTYDLIINMDFHQEHHQHYKYNKYRSKMIYLGLPLIEKKKSIKHNYFRKYTGRIHCVYAGALSKSLRNPKYLCSLFNDFNQREIRLHFFSRGDCQEMLEDYEKRSNQVIVSHAFLPEEEMDQVLQSADILINIGNHGTQMVPSKIFSYITYGKPILHIYQDDEDSCLDYLRAYPLALCIKEDEAHRKEQVQEVYNFMKRKRHRTVHFHQVKKEFNRNTPSYSASVIHGFLYPEKDNDS